jgi:hypothetical protein
LDHRKGEDPQPGSIPAVALCSRLNGGGQGCADPPIVRQGGELESVKNGLAYIRHEAALDWQTGRAALTLCKAQIAETGSQCCLQELR